jgi:hypothetical protein
MKIGDLVTWRNPTSTRNPPAIGLVVETGKYTGNADVKVLWNRGTDMHYPHVHNSKFLKLLTSS